MNPILCQMQKIFIIVYLFLRLILQLLYLSYFYICVTYSKKTLYFSPTLAKNNVKLAASFCFKHIYSQLIIKYNSILYFRT